MNEEKKTALIKQWATELGFDHCGVARSQRLDEDAKRLENWLSSGMHGTMRYMENHFEMRVDPGKLVPGARSVITLLQNYYPNSHQSADTATKVSKYAFGEDYHEVIRDKLKLLLHRMRQQFGEIQGRGFVDSAPVLERAWAMQSGLGWIGKNGNLINKTGGSFFFICTLITDLGLRYDDAYAKDYCGTCTRCIDACPTEAISENKIVNGSRCISYFTIELKDQLIRDDMKGRFDDWLFGCDTCQDVCPWNRFSVPHHEERFTPLNEILQFGFDDWAALTEESFRSIFRRSPLKRAKLKGIHRNLIFLNHTISNDDPTPPVPTG